MLKVVNQIKAATSTSCGVSPFGVGTEEEAILVHADRGNWTVSDLPAETEHDSSSHICEMAAVKAMLLHPQACSTHSVHLAPTANATPPSHCHHSTSWHHRDTVAACHPAVNSWGSGEVRPKLCQLAQPVPLATMAMAALAAGRAEAKPGSEEEATDGGNSQGSRKIRTQPHELAQVLSVGEDTARKLISQEPDLQHHPAARLRAALQRLASLLKVDMEVAQGLAVKQPRVLLVPQGQLEPRLKDLALMLEAAASHSCLCLCTSSDEAVLLVLQQPGLLTHQQGTLRARVLALMQLLRLGKAPDAALVAIRREPGLLVVRHAQLESKLQQLAQALGSSRVDPAIQLTLTAPTTLLLPAPKLEAKVVALAKALSLPHEAAGQLVLTQPRLLTLAADQLGVNLRGLAACLGAERQAAAVMCTELPSLLLLGPAQAQERVQLLARALDVSEVRCRGLCASKPHLLLKDPEAVKQALQEARRSGQLPPPPRP
ncbi:hypothetical protein QJQ45_022639 [Haematococcus lacustris]|nr:hypothetical protein QJQ45_022639 [Haematococcus lacustris]